jgi:hypothetical protein
MSLEITTSDRRFTIKCKYEKSLIEYFNTIDKRYFDYDKQTWSFPVDKLDAFKEHIVAKAKVHRNLNKKCRKTFGYKQAHRAHIFIIH